MKRSLFLSLILLTPLLSRENPFFALDPSKSQKLTSNTIETKPPMGIVNYTLPDQARILKEVTFTIQNLDGSIENRKIVIDQSIDWHRKITLSQSSHNQIHLANHKTSADFGFIRFDVNGKLLSIRTTDPLSRHFVLSDPNRIVLDFNRHAIFKTEQKQLNTGIYQNVMISNHGKFVRATITLDGRYRYTLKKLGESITILCE